MKGATEFLIYIIEHEDVAEEDEDKREPSEAVVREQYVPKLASSRSKCSVCLFDTDLVSNV